MDLTQITIVIAIVWGAKSSIGKFVFSLVQ